MKLFLYALYIFVFELFRNAQCLRFLKEENYDKSLQVETNNGIVQGVRRKMDNGKDMFVYRGIPFAKPPLFNLRFREPQQHVNWSGVLDATLKAPSCVEFWLRISGLSVGGSEDCLYLDVYSPVMPQSDEIVPVVYWIYGGAFYEGNMSIYNPEYLLMENVVFVASNYRIGIFGFLSTEDEAAVGNYGLKDQNAALKWIQSNIKNFGGNPNQVTIMGQSAGGASVMYHMVSPKSKGLFHGAIAMSGTNISPWSFKRNPKKVASDVSLHLGIPMGNTTTFIDTLRKMDSESLIYGQIIPIMTNLIQAYQNGLVFAPSIEPDHNEAFITESSYNLLESGRFNGVPLIIGATTMESKFFYQQAALLLRPLLITFDLSPSSFPTGMNIPSFYQRRKVGYEIRKKYFQSESVFSSTDEELLHYLNDAFFIKPVHKTIQLITKYVPVYMYIFDYQGETAQKFLKKSGFLVDGMTVGPNKGVGHVEDITYIWKFFGINEKDKPFSTRFIKILSNFIKYRNPTPKVDKTLQNVIWPYISTPNSTSYLYIGENFTVRQNYRKSYMKFWDKLYDQFCEKPFFTY